jgi:LmbE family N-acetylglucosaminyl deacetylase
MAERVLLVSPHLDDAVLSAWSVLTEAGAVDVVNVCTALPPAGILTRYDRLVRATESASLFAERLAEDREALALAGREPRGLGFLERQYASSPLDLGGLAAAIARELEDATRVYLPAGIGAHDDHVAVRDAGLEAAAGAGIQATLYAEVPYAVHKGWPHWVVGGEPDPHLDPDSDWEVYLQTVPVAREALVAEARRLGAEEAAAKLAALRTYRTQFASLRSGIVDRFSNPDVLAHEVFWRVDGRGA